jgi:hypothetical protein
MVHRANASGAPDPRSQRTGACSQNFCTERGLGEEIPGVTGCHPQPARSGKAKGRTLDMYAPGKSDGGIVSIKRMNKGVPSRQGRDQPPADFVEKRPSAKGNLVQATVTGTQGPEAASSGLNRVREAAQTAHGPRPWWGHHKVP